MHLRHKYGAEDIKRARSKLLGRIIYVPETSGRFGFPIAGGYYLSEVTVESGCRVCTPPGYLIWDYVTIKGLSEERVIYKINRWAETHLAKGIYA